MGYRVLWTPDAEHDLDVIIGHLADGLGMPQAAQRLLGDIESLVQTLKTLPFAHELSRDPFLAGRGYHKAVVSGYVVLYLVDKDTGTVVLTNIVHGSRDYARLI